jgi:hypothetical protein
MDLERLKQRIRENASEIVRLHSRIHETFVHRWKSAEKRREWEQACAEFHHYSISWHFRADTRGGPLTRVMYGDPKAMEAAICFLEIRPYFLRSGYIFKDILRKCRRAPLSGRPN